MVREITFDGIVGPSLNFSGLSFGNLAATQNVGRESLPCEAALKGIAKVPSNVALGLVQGLFLPQARPDDGWLEALGASITKAEPTLRANALSAFAMWAANGATVSPAPDTADGRCHLTVVNPMTMPHRSHEWPGTLDQLRFAFADAHYFTVHELVPAPFGDEGAANHMRFCSTYAASGVEVFVYGEAGGFFPARQHGEASAAVARRHLLEAVRALFVRQSPAAIAAGAFHNDAVAVTNENVLFTPEQASADPDALYSTWCQPLPDVKIIEVPASTVSLGDAIESYLFNAQLVTLPSGGMALILPTEAQCSDRVSSRLSPLVASNGPIRKLVLVEVRESMSNGGGPACLRLGDHRSRDNRSALPDGGRTYGCLRAGHRPVLTRQDRQRRARRSRSLGSMPSRARRPAFRSRLLIQRAVRL